MHLRSPLSLLMILLASDGQCYRSGGSYATIKRTLRRGPEIRFREIMIQERGQSTGRPKVIRGYEERVDKRVSQD